jgi:hypothetical protein
MSNALEVIILRLASLAQDKSALSNHYEYKA